jgi:ABC-type glycerol-3-phosphate transport system substrate-binding protein
MNSMSERAPLVAAIVLLLCSGVTIGWVFGTGQQDTVGEVVTPELSVFWHVEFAAIEEDNPIVQIIGEKTRTKLRYLSIPWNAYQEKLNLAIASGDMADIMTTSGPSDANFFNWIDEGVFLPLDNYLEKAPNINSRISPVLMDSMVMPDSKIYAVPRLWTANHVFYVREDWLKKFNLQMPKTLDDVYAVAKAWGQDPDGNGTKDTYALGSFGGNGLFWLRWVSAAFDLPWEQFKKVDGEWKYGSAAPETKEWVVYLKRMYEEGYLDPEFMVISGGDARNKFYQGKWGMAGMPSGDYGRANDVLSQNDPNVRVAVIPPPKASDGTGGYAYGRPLTDDGIGVWMAASIANTCDYPEAAMRVMDFLVSEEGSELAFWGREGVDYRKTGPKQYERLISMEEMEKLGMPIYISFLTGEPRYSVISENPWTEEQDRIYAAIGKAVYTDYLAVPPMNDRMRELVSDLTSFTRENLVNFIIGKRDISEFDVYLDEWNSRGGTELLKELEKEVSR